MKNIFSALVILIAVLLSACGAINGRAEARQAEQTLVNFFQALADGDYLAAAELYGGDYEVLRSMNPTISAGDDEALWRAGCELNGLQCLPVLRVLEKRKLSTNEFFFTLEFKDAQGKAFVLGPCCGANAEEMPPISSFEYRVSLKGGRFSVLDLPVFVP